MLIRTVVKKMVYGSLTWMLSDDNGRVKTPTLQGPAQGLRFRVDLMGGMEAGYFLGSYDLPVLQQLQTICQPGWTVWDCGTYLGYYTCFFARLVGPQGRVVAVEPDPRNLERTRQHAEMNGLRNVTYVNMAVGAPIGETEFLLQGNTNSHLPGTYVGAAPATRAAAAESIRIRSVGLDEAYRELGWPRPSLIKLDIEGAEKFALPHLSQLAREVRPLIVLELHNPDCDEQAWQFQRETGYQLYSLDRRAAVTRREDVQGTLLCSPG